MKWVMILLVALAALALLRLGGARRPASTAPSSPSPRPPREEKLESLSAAEFLWLREQLEAKRFELVAAELDELVARAAKNVRQEIRLMDVVGVFQRPVPADAALYAEWLARTPDRFQPYLARGAYLYGMAWKARGAAARDGTSAEQFRRFGELLAESKKDIDRALRVAPKLFPAHVLRIGLGIGMSDRAAVAAASRDALRLSPASYEARSYLMWSAQPRWGGSLEAMERVMQEAQSHLATNPQLALLKGRIYEDMSDVLGRQQAYAHAKDLLDKALACGESWRFYKARAALRFSILDKDAEALADVQRAIALKPASAAVRLLAASIHLHKRDLDRGTAELEMALRLDPAADGVAELAKGLTAALKAEGHKAFRGKPSEAFRLYGLALRCAPRDPDLICWRAEAMGRLGRYEEADRLLALALEIDPERFETHLAVDHVLLPQQRHREIIEGWDRFLAARPKDARGYSERAGTHQHAGNMDSAIADLETACRMGDREACGHLQSVRR